jgi:hypothetical protein
LQGAGGVPATNWSGSGENVEGEVVEEVQGEEGSEVV